MRKIVLILTIMSLTLLGSIVSAQEEDAENGEEEVVVICEDVAPEPRLIGEIEGQVAQSYSSLRQAPGSAVILDVMTNGDGFIITGDAVCSGVHWWYPITFDLRDGWVTEGQGDIYWIQAIEEVEESEEAADPGTGGGGEESTEEFGTGGPDLIAEVGEEADDGTFVDPHSGVSYVRSTEACEGAPEAFLAPSLGLVAKVVQRYSSLRLGIHSDTILESVQNGEEMTIVDGPFCATDMDSPYSWYLAEYDGTQGWVTEGTGDDYWLEVSSF